METKYFIFYGALAVMLQVIPTNSQGDPRIQACLEKLTDQISTISFDKLPSCFDKQKFGDGIQQTKLLQEFYLMIPANCRKVSSSNIVDCLKIIRQIMDSHSDDIKSTIINSLYSFVASGKQCFDNVKLAYQNLDTYILNGCQGSLLT